MKQKETETCGEQKPRSAQRDASHKKCSAQRDALHAKNWKEYMATVEDIQNFLMDRILLRHNVITGRVEYRLPDSMRGYIVVRRSAEEMRSLRSVMAQESSEPTSAPDANTDTDDTVIF
jgi:hypothetical protein